MTDGVEPAAAQLTASDFKRFKGHRGASSAMGGNAAQQTISYADLKAWRMDTAVEKHLPRMKAAQKLQVVKLPSLLSEQEVLQVHALYAELAPSLRTHSYANDPKEGLRPGWGIAYLSTDGSCA